MVIKQERQRKDKEEKEKRPQIRPMQISYC